MMLHEGLGYQSRGAYIFYLEGIVDADWTLRGIGRKGLHCTVSGDS